jgi:hypothetical protein
MIVQQELPFTITLLYGIASKSWKSKGLQKEIIHTWEFDYDKIKK